MSKIAYTEQKIIDAINNFIANEEIETLYKAKGLSSFIGYTGETSDTKEKYTELISRKIMESDLIEKLKGIKTIERKRLYNVSRENVKKAKDCGNEEAKIEREMLEQKKIEGLGEILSCQIPLKSTKKDKGVGEIDLLSYDEKTNVLRILELKKPESTETMLRCVLEAYTYLCQVDSGNLIEQFGNADTQLRAAPLVAKSSNQREEIEDGENSKYLKELMKRLGMNEVFCYEKVDGKYKVEIVSI